MSKLDDENFAGRSKINEFDLVFVCLNQNSLD